MVIPASDRIAKYALKFDPTIVSSRWTAMKDVAIAKATAKFESLSDMESDVQVILNADTIITNDRPKYYNFAREIWALVAGGVADPRLTAEAIILSAKYSSKACSVPTLQKIALNVFSITIP